jgi:hypothetical protein
LRPAASVMVMSLVWLLMGPGTPVPALLFQARRIARCPRVAHS